MRKIKIVKNSLNLENCHKLKNIQGFVLARGEVRCPLLTAAVQWLGGEDAAGACSEAVCGDN